MEMLSFRSVKSSIVDFLCFHLPVQRLFDPVPDDLAYQAQWKRLVHRELNRSLGSFVPRELLFERPNSGRSRIESDVMFECGEMHEIAFKSEGGDLIFDPLFCCRSGLSDGLPDVFQQQPHILGKKGNILVDILYRYHPFSRIVCFRSFTSLMRRFLQNRARSFVARRVFRQGAQAEERSQLRLCRTIVDQAPALPRCLQSKARSRVFLWSTKQSSPSPLQSSP